MMVQMNDSFSILKRRWRFAIQGTGVARADQVPDNTVNPVGGPCENLSILIIQNFIQHLS
jgi:hypothetical protein